MFIGRSRYKEGALLTIKAFEILRERNNKLRLNIIGLNSDDFDSLPEGVTCHGFLKKDIESQCELYYNLILKASLIINPQKIWAGYSSIIEAMYFFTPILITPFDDFIEEFGENIKFGAYTESSDPEEIAKSINAILDSYDYKEKCKNAHETVKEYTWENYVDKLLNVL